MTDDLLEPGVHGGWGHRTFGLDNSTVEPVELPVAKNYESPFYAPTERHWIRPDGYVHVLEVPLETADLIMKSGACTYNLYIDAKVVCQLFSLENKNARTALEKVGLKLYRMHTAKNAPLLVRVRDLAEWYASANFVFKPKDLRELEYLCEKLGFKLRQRAKNGDSIPVNSRRKKVSNRNDQQHAAGDDQQ